MARVFTSPIVLPADPSSSNHASNKNYVDTGLSGKQASSADLTSIAGLSPSNDDVIQRKSGSWVNRTIAQLKTDLGVGTPSTYTITYAGTISADRANGTNQKVTATGAITSLGVSATGAVDGETITIRVLASGANRVVTPATGVIGAKTVPSTKVGFFQFMYDSDAAAYVHVGYGASG